MELKCVGCNTTIPSGASRCPMCGAPIERPIKSMAQTEPKTKHYGTPPTPKIVTEVHHHHQVSTDKPIQIEATGKKWKKLYLYAWGFLFLSMASCTIGVGSASTTMSIFTLIFFVAALFTYIRARFGAWWHHG